MKPGNTYTIIGKLWIKDNRLDYVHRWILGTDVPWTEIPVLTLDISDIEC